MPAGPSEPATDGRIDAGQIAHVLWHQRPLVIASLLLGASAGAGVSAWSTRHRTEALLLTPGLTVAEYKPAESALASPARLAAFLAQRDSTEQVAGALIQETLETPGGFEGAIRLSFAFTERDARQFGVKSDESMIVGVRLALEQRAPSVQSPVRLLGEFVRDTMMQVDMQRRIPAGCAENRRRQHQLRREQIQAEFETRQRRARAEALAEILERHPGAAQSDLRQVVSVGKGEDRFLSPTAQLVAVEVELADLELSAEVRRRERIAVDLKATYYCAARDMLSAQPTGRRLLTALQDLQAQISTTPETADDAAEAASLELLVELHTWQLTYFDEREFAAAPEGTQSVVRRPRYSVGVAAGLLLGLAIGVGLALGRAWWRTHRSDIVASEH